MGGGGASKIVFPTISFEVVLVGTTNFNHAELGAGGG